VHLNPAVALEFRGAGRFSRKLVSGNIAAQLIGVFASLRRRSPGFPPAGRYPVLSQAVLASWEGPTTFDADQRIEGSVHVPAAEGRQILKICEQDYELMGFIG
jgi:hypothetical protein